MRRWRGRGTREGGRPGSFKPLSPLSPAQVEHTYAYWELNYGLVNEMGLGFAESTCGTKTVGFSPRNGGPNLLCIEGGVCC